MKRNNLAAGRRYLGIATAVLAQRNDVPDATEAEKISFFGRT